MNEETLLAGLLHVLVGATVSVLLMQRLRVPLVPTFFVAGALLGWLSFGVAESPEQLREISHLAVILLLFGIGLDLRIDALKHDLRRTLSACIGACVVSALALWPVALLFNFSVRQAAVVAMALSLSSTAVVLSMLTERRELPTPTGRLAIAVLVAQDIAVLLMLAVLPAIAALDGAKLQSAAGWGYVGQVMRMAGSIALLFFAGRLLFPLIIKEAGRFGSAQALLVVALALALGTAELAQLLGFSLEMGAFLAGLVLSGSAQRHQLSGQIFPLRDFFMAVYFVALGMQLDLMLIWQHLPLILAALMLLLALKAILIAAVLWLSRFPLPHAVTAGIWLAQAGEFSLVLLGSAGDLGLFTGVQSGVLLAVVILSLMTTPGLFRFADTISLHLVALSGSTKGSAAHGEGAAGKRTGHALVVGYGPVGKYVCDALIARKIEVVVIEMNPALAVEAQAGGAQVVVGDARSAPVGEAARLETAALVVIAVADERAAGAMVQRFREENSRAFIAARVHHEANIEAFRRSGADFVNAEERQAGAALVQAALSCFEGGKE